MRVLQAASLAHDWMQRTSRQGLAAFGQQQYKFAAAANFATQNDIAAEQCRHASRNAQSQPGTAELSACAAIGLLECVEMRSSLSAGMPMPLSWTLMTSNG